MTPIHFKIALVVSFCVFSFSFPQAQDLLNTQTHVTSSTGLIYEIDRRDKTIQGSPYIVDNFQPARVSADVEKIFNARYNAITDEVEVESDRNTPQSINKMIPGITVTFLKDNKTYKGMTYFNEVGNSITGYLVPINNENENVKLFLKERKIFIEHQPAKSSYQEDKPAKFERLDDTFYVAIKNEIARPLSNKKKEVAALFPNNEIDILKYISSEKLNLKKQEDLIKLFAYINKF